MTRPEESVKNKMTARVRRAAKEDVALGVYRTFALTIVILVVVKMFRQLA
jgi:hypothetical protein